MHQPGPHGFFVSLMTASLVALLWKTVMPTSSSRIFMTLMRRAPSLPAAMVDALLPSSLSSATAAALRLPGALGVAGPLVTSETSDPPSRHHAWSRGRPPCVSDPVREINAAS